MHYYYRKLNNLPVLVPMQYIEILLQAQHVYSNVIDIIDFSMTSNINHQYQ